MQSVYRALLVVLATNAFDWVVLVKSVYLNATSTRIRRFRTVCVGEIR